MMISLRQLVILSFIVNGALLALIILSSNENVEPQDETSIQEIAEIIAVTPTPIPPLPKPLPPQAVLSASTPPLPKAKTAPTPKPQVADNAEYYVLKNGDNPWKIARQQKLKFSDLLKLNNLDEKKAKQLKPGDKIRIR